MCKFIEIVRLYSGLTKQIHFYFKKKLLLF